MFFYSNTFIDLSTDGVTVASIVFPWETPGNILDSIASRLTGKDLGQIRQTDDHMHTDCTVSDDTLIDSASVVRL